LGEVQLGQVQLGQVQLDQVQLGGIPSIVFTIFKTILSMLWLQYSKLCRTVTHHLYPPTSSSLDLTGACSVALETSFSDIVIVPCTIIVLFVALSMEIILYSTFLCSNFQVR
jgi:hypothetical protein